jgi:disulfide bond formation protein DsbB
MPRLLVRSIVVGLAALGAAGQAIIALLLVAALLSVVGRPALLAFVRRLISGYEHWLAFLVAALATTGSLFFSEVAHFTPCALCWYERICMYPLAILTLIAAARGGRRAARWLLPVSVIGAGLSVYHVLIENGLAPQFMACLLSLPGGCGMKWIDEFGFMTIPTLALTGFALIVAFLLFAAAGPKPPHHVAE